MPIEITEHGIVQVVSQEEIRIVRPARNGGAPTIIEVPVELAERHRLADGDIVGGATEPVLGVDCEDSPDMEIEDDFQPDEPRSAPIVRMPLAYAQFPSLRLTAVNSVNGLSADLAEERPFAKTRRSDSERARPDRWIQLTTSAGNPAGRAIDLVAPLGNGITGAIVGPHGSGLTHTMRDVAAGVVSNAPDCVVIMALIQARGEEVTHIRRRFPTIDVVVCPSASHEVARDAAVLLPMLMLKAAQRQTEQGKDVVLMIDSLTALWGMMLENEDATDQRGADTSRARQQIREFLQAAGCFHGRSPLGGDVGGSLSIIGAVWDQPVDEEAEEDREVHPHLRLLEQIASDLSWRVTLSGELAALRMFPAIDGRRCFSRIEDAFVPAAELASMIAFRSELPRDDLPASYAKLTDAANRVGT